MRQWRSRISCFTPATLGLFLASVTVLRPGLFFHTHAGGDHIHVHDEEPGEPATHNHHAAAHGHHAHHDEPAHYDLSVPAFETPDDDDALGHWHTQSPIHRVAPVAVRTVFRPQLVWPAPAQPRFDCVIGAVAASRARSPPLLTVN